MASVSLRGHKIGLNLPQPFRRCESSDQPQRVVFTEVPGIILRPFGSPQSVKLYFT